MKKKIIIFLLVLFVLLGIYMLYNTFAINSYITSNNDIYTIELAEDNNTVVVPSNSHKTVYYHIKNINNGAIKYGVGYNTSSNVDVFIYDDSKDKAEDIIGYGENKYIKLYLSNRTSSDSTVTMSTILGYENGGDLIVPSGVALVERVCSYKGLATNTLIRLGLEVDNSHTPDFTTVSGNSGVEIDERESSEIATGLGDGTNGIYIADDDLGASYYFRGNVTNNYVTFAGYYWRIIRINGDGTIRMIYAGSSAHANGESETDSRIGTSAYNSSYKDNAYVGYMYGTSGSPVYNETHANTNNSTIKGVIDTWYKTNIVDKGYTSKVADAIYCNDREAVKISKGTVNFSGNGIGTSITAYASKKRVSYEHNLTLKCTNDNDKFTVSSELGNGALTYPVALITADELSYAGVVGYDSSTYYYIINNEVYLYTPSYTYWTMSPDSFLTDSSYILILDPDITGFRVHASCSVRPVISLKADAIVGGDGTMTNPFVA